MSGFEQGVPYFGNAREDDEQEPFDLVYYPGAPILPPGQVGTIVLVVDGELDSETRVMVTENIEAYPGGPRNVSFLVDPEHAETPPQPEG